MSLINKLKTSSIMFYHNLQVVVLSNSNAFFKYKFVYYPIILHMNTKRYLLKVVILNCEQILFRNIFYVIHFLVSENDF